MIPDTTFKFNELSYGNGKQIISDYISSCGVLEWSLLDYKDKNF